MKFKKGDRVISVKSLEPYKKWGCKPFLREIVFDGVGAVDEVKETPTGIELVRIGDSWYTSEMLKLASEATENDYKKIRVCEECGSPSLISYISNQPIYLTDSDGKAKRALILPDMECYYCPECGHFEVPMEDVKRTASILEELHKEGL